MSMRKVLWSLLKVLGVVVGNFDGGMGQFEWCRIEVGEDGLYGASLSTSMLVDGFCFCLILWGREGLRG